MFAYQIGRYRHINLPSGVTLAGGMFQHNIDEIFKELPKVFGIAADILIVGVDADGSDHGRTFRRIMQICQKENIEKK